MLTAIVAATVLFSGVAPVALAADDAAGQGSVVATRSDWGGVESLDVPQTKSQAEKDAEERAAAEQQAREQAAAAAQQQASRSSDRSDLTTDNSSSSTSTVTVTPPDGTSVSSLLSFAGQFVGKVPYVSGGNTPSGWHYSGAQATAGRAVGSLAEAQPGDIIANSQHAAIYVGNGMVINSQLNGTRYDPIAWVFPSSYSIRRIF